MKKINLIKIITPIVTATTLAAAIPLFSSCSKSDSKPDKRTTTTLNLKANTNINAERPDEEVSTPAYMYNDSAYATAKVSITIPFSEEPLVTMYAQKGKRRGNEITWIPYSQGGITLLTDATTTFDCTYGQPLRFFLADGATGRLSNTPDGLVKIKIMGDGPNGEFEDNESGVQLRGTLISMLCKSYDPVTGTVVAYNQLTPNSVRDNGAFMGLFSESTALFGIGPDLLPFKVLNNSCYRDMFKGCTNLRTVPTLPATQCWNESEEIVEGLPLMCYRSMFDGCINLQIAPHLPARILNGLTYYRMFAKTELKTISTSFVGNLHCDPEAPSETTTSYNFADILANDDEPSNNRNSIVFRYNGLDDLNKSFSQTPPEPLNVNTITQSEDWINSNLKTIEIKDDSSFDKQTSTLGSDKPHKFRVYKDFKFKNVEQEFPKYEPLSEYSRYELSWYDGTTNKKIENIETREASQLPSVLIPRYLPDITEDAKYTNVICESDATLTVNNTTESKPIYYRMKPNDPWSQLPIKKSGGKTINWIDIPAGTNLQLCGNIKNTNTSGVNLVLKLKDDAKGTPIRLTGNVMSLIRGQNGADPSVAADITLQPTETFAFANLFKGSTGIGEVADDYLPSTVVTKDAYYQMFYGCSKLKNMPTLKATQMTESCYEGMFYDCGKLASAYTDAATPVCKLKATTAAKACFKNMFAKCKTLAKAPILPTIETAPVSCYEAMFSGCTNLTVDENFKFSATKASQKCYYQMFKECTNLVSFPGETNIKLTDLCPGNVKAQDACREMFYGCESLIEPLDLPAIKIYGACYYSIYEGCISMKRPAILGNGAQIVDDVTGAADCMFNGCKSMTIYDQTNKPQNAVLCFFAWEDASTGNLPKEVYTGAKGSWATVETSTGTRLKTGYKYYYVV